MALSGEEANHAKDAHEGQAPPSKAPHESLGKKVSEDGISKGSSQDGTAPVKGSPVGRCTPSSLLCAARRQQGSIMGALIDTKTGRCVKYPQE